MMRILSLTLLLAAPLLAEPRARLTFADQSVISGDILQVDPATNTLSLTSPFLKGQASLNTSQLLDLHLQHEGTTPEEDHYALATVMPRFDDRPQDTIRGTLVGVDEDVVTLNTWYAGELKLKRTMVKELNIYAQSPSLYSGPTGLDGWISSSGKVADHWAYRNRSLISKSSNSIARQIEMGERVKLSFDVAWRSSPYFRISFLADSGKQRYPGIGYTFQVQNSYIHLYRSGPNQGRADLLNENTRHLREQETAKFVIYLDKRPDGKNGLFIDGKKIGEWEGTNDLEGMGEWIIFTPQSGNPIRVSQISVTQWDGNLPQASDADEKVATGNIFKGLSGERIDLANGDALLGSINGITEGRANVKTELGDMSLPVNRLRSFRLDLKKKEEPRMWKEDVRAWFTEGGFVTIKLISMDDKKLKGFSQVFGEAEFDLSAFARIEFNVWEPNLEEARNGSDLDW
ncbi:MAG: hypothetical protein ACSHYF_03225 [Verrucomicrobiaceae bacterium]